MKKLNLYGLICISVILLSAVIPVQAAPTGCPNSILVVAFDKDGEEIGTFYLSTANFFAYYRGSRVDPYSLGSDILALACSLSGYTCIALPGGYVYFGDIYQRTWLGDMMSWLTPGYYIIPLKTSDHVVLSWKGYEKGMLWA